MNLVLMFSNTYSTNYYADKTWKTLIRRCFMKTNKPLSIYGKLLEIFSKCVVLSV